MLSGYKIKDIANLSTHLKIQESICNEPECLMFCQDILCTAVAFIKPNKQCQIKKYGRVLLEYDANAVSWIKSKHFSFLSILVICVRSYPEGSIVGI